MRERYQYGLFNRKIVGGELICHIFKAITYNLIQRFTYKICQRIIIVEIVELIFSMKLNLSDMGVQYLGI